MICVTEQDGLRNKLSSLIPNRIYLCNFIPHIKGHLELQSWNLQYVFVSQPLFHDSGNSGLLYLPSQNSIERTLGNRGQCLSMGEIFFWFLTSLMNNWNICLSFIHIIYQISYNLLITYSISATNWSTSWLHDTGDSESRWVKQILKLFSIWWLKAER